MELDELIKGDSRYADLANRNVFTTGQIAKLCNVSARTVTKWFDRGALKGYRIPLSQDRRVTRENLIAFLREHGMPGAETVAWHPTPTCAGSASCCSEGRTIRWKDADAIYGPERSGWAICDGATDGGSAGTYTNVLFCPWCGKELPRLKPIG